MKRQRKKTDEEIDKEVEDFLQATGQADKDNALAKEFLKDLVKSGTKLLKEPPKGIDWSKVRF